jgi:predicted nucleotidyltransferase
MKSESGLEQRVANYFSDKGWNIIQSLKVRGRKPDIIALKDDKIALIEVKSYGGNIKRDIEQALHFWGAGNFSYLVIPKEDASIEMRNTCENLGIGLILIDDEMEEAVEAVQSNSLPSVRKKILGISLKKQESKLVVLSSLEKLFKSRSQILILKLLFLNSTKEFHLNDIARKTGLAPSTAINEVYNLLELNLVTKRIQGNLTLYGINKKSMIFDELKRIFLKYELFDEIIAQELPADKINYALIYGSFAKSTENELSDIDLLVVGNLDENTLLAAIRNIEGKIGRELNFILWNNDEFVKKSEEGISFLKEIVNNPIIMIIGDKNEFTGIITKGND